MVNYLQKALKTINFVSIALFSLFLSSCDDPEELTFPVTFNYQGLDFQPSKYYVLTANAYTEIPAKGNYESFDHLLEESKILDIEQTQFPFNSIELFSETLIKVVFFDYLNIPATSFSGSWSFHDEKVFFVIPGVTDTLPIVLSEDYEQASFPIFE